MHCLSIAAHPNASGRRLAATALAMSRCHHSPADRSLWRRPSSGSNNSSGVLPYTTRRASWSARPGLCRVHRRSPARPKPRARTPLPPQLEKKAPPGPTAKQSRYRHRHRRDVSPATCHQCPPRETNHADDQQVPDQRQQREQNRKWIDGFKYAEHACLARLGTPYFMNSRSTHLVS